MTTKEQLKREVIKKNKGKIHRQSSFEISTLKKLTSAITQLNTQLKSINELKTDTLRFHLSK